MLAAKFRDLNCRLILLVRGLLFTSSEISFFILLKYSSGWINLKKNHNIKQSCHNEKHQNSVFWWGKVLEIGYLILALHEIILRSTVVLTFALSSRSADISWNKQLYSYMTDTHDWRWWSHKTCAQCLLHSTVPSQEQFERIVSGLLT